MIDDPPKIAGCRTEATGETVYLLPEHYSNGSHADALANSIFSDVKNITSKNNTKVVTRFLEGRLQGDNVFIHVKNNSTTVQDVFKQLSRINKEGDLYEGKDLNKDEGKVFVITDYDNKVSLFKINKDGSISEPSYLHPASLNKDSPVSKNINPSNNSVNKNIYLQTVFHGSGANFERFNTDEYGLSGEGSMSFGYGTYLTDDEEIARAYAERQGGKDNNRELNQLKIRLELANRLLKELEENTKKEESLEEIDYLESEISKIDAPPKIAGR